MATTEELEAKMQTLEQSINFLVTDIIKPLSEAVVATQQLTQANQERFDRLLLSHAEDRNVAEQARAEQAHQIQTLLEDAREDRRQNRSQFDSQMQALQAQLLQIATLNHRIDRLEQQAS